MSNLNNEIPSFDMEEHQRRVKELVDSLTLNLDLGCGSSRIEKKYFLTDKEGRIYSSMAIGVYFLLKRIDNRAARATARKVFRKDFI